MEGGVLQKRMGRLKVTTEKACLGFGQCSKKEIKKRREQLNLSQDSEGQTDLQSPA